MIRQFFSGIAFLTIAFGSVGEAAARGDLDGVYVGGILGYENYKAALVADGVSVGSEKVSDIAGAAILGFDIEMHGWHLAIEGEFAWSGAGETVIIDAGGDPITASVSADRTVGVAVRYGFAFDDILLLYGRLGWARSRFDLTATGGGIDISAVAKLDGLAFGGGLEWAATKHISLRAEYVRINYESALEGLLDVSRNTFRGGVALRF